MFPPCRSHPTSAHMHPHMLGSRGVHTDTTFTCPKIQPCLQSACSPHQSAHTGSHGWCLHPSVLSGAQRAASECQLPMNPAHVATAGIHMTLWSPEAELRQQSCVPGLGQQVVLPPGVVADLHGSSYGPSSGTDGAPWRSRSWLFLFLLIG